ncbi:MAG TPA: hypothetical protein VF593_00345 [Chthoniobacteraceae bacterium]|jgi:hypothetical protein
MSLKAIKLAQRSSERQRQVIGELEALVKSIERGEKMIVDLKAELEAVNVEHQDRKTTRDDVAYLEALLRCAKKKLVWEKQMAALQKRTPIVLAEVSDLLNDTRHSPNEETRASLLRSLQAVQAAMHRLELVKVE